jgi:hypothetical protein
MPISTLQDALVMDELNRRAMAPLTTYGQGILAIAIQDRARRQQLEDQARAEQFAVGREQRQEQFATEREKRLEEYEKGREERAAGRELGRETREAERRKGETEAQFKHEEEMIKKRAYAEAEVRMAEHDKLETEAQEKERQAALREARGLGISKETLPDNASYTDIIVEQYKAHGRELVQGAHSVRDMFQGRKREELAAFAEAYKTGMTKAIADRVVNAKVLKDAGVTSADLNKLMTPGGMQDLQTKLIKDKNEAGLVLLNQINSDAADNTSKELEILAKSKPEYLDMKEKFDLASKNFFEIRKLGKFDEKSRILADETLLQDVLPAAGPGGGAAGGGGPGGGGGTGPPKFGGGGGNLPPPVTSPAAIRRKAGLPPLIWPDNPPETIPGGAWNPAAGGTRPGELQQLGGAISTGLGWLNRDVWGNPIPPAPPAVPRAALPGSTMVPSPFWPPVPTPSVYPSTDPQTATQLRLQRALADIGADRAGIAPTAFGGGVPGYGPFTPPMPGVAPMLFGPNAMGQEPEPFVPYGP